MKSRLLVAALASAALLSGCSSLDRPTGDINYSESNSRAYNLARAGGLYQARDRAVSADEYAVATSTVSDAFGASLALSSSHGLGLSSGGAIGLGLASALLAPPGTMERSSAFFFVPIEEAETRDEAVELVLSLYIEALAGASDALELEPHGDNPGDDPAVRFQRSGREGAGMFLINPEVGCPSREEVESFRDMCLASLQIPVRPRSPGQAPLAIGGEGQVHPFTATHKTRYPRFVLRVPDDAAALRPLLAAQISARMPEWFFAYLAPSRKHGTPPMVFEKGEPQLFIVKK
jgi:outer membrane lipoprotein SlyB